MAGTDNAKPVDPALRVLLLEQLARMACRPCECAARRKRAELPAEDPFYLAPEFVTCDGCLAGAALARALREGVRG